MTSNEILNILLISTASIAALAVIFGVGLAIASKVFAIDTDPRVDKILENLPGVNCGACGSAGCASLAEAIVKGEAPADACPVATETARKIIGEIMGAAVSQKERRVAVLLCNGGTRVDSKHHYSGVHDCLAASLLHGGAKQCDYGCLGLGTCVEACPFEALIMGGNGLPQVIEERCKACAKCAEACPKNLFVIQPLSKSVHVRCKSCDKGAVTKRNCSVGCIGCKKCEKECPVDAIKVDNFLAQIDYTKCISCGKCAKVCPQGCIADFRKARKAGVVIPSAAVCMAAQQPAQAARTA
ncbi:MAG TPA: RnfABCDGE type electron transport complex subunit B [Planctomycetota bacterium]|nr:RnfABCDGE type electron transport complex subunit B [Planctomycetota bacterium]